VTRDAPSARFRTTLLSARKNATGIEVPPEVVAALGPSKRPAVHVTIGSHTYPSTIAVMGGAFMIPVSAENREAAGIAAGQEIEVFVRLDLEPRTVEVPVDLASALDAVPAARTFFDGLSNSVKKVHVLAADGAKTPETRARRIAKSVEMLAEGKAR
jgi:hypothetical protein